MQKGCGDDAAGKLAAFTTMRHDIVHRGGKPYIKRAQAAECARLTRDVAFTIDRDVVARLGA